MSHSTEFLEQNSKLEWMYKNNADLLNREEYLLGRAIDKNFEQLNAEENEQKEKLVGVTVPKNHVEHECIPFSIRSYRSLQNMEQVDLQRKIIEDPLMAIRQKEMESRRKILENPVKLKELHKLLKKEKSNDKSSSKKKSKNKDKRKSKKKRSHSSSEEDDLDNLLAKKYKKIQQGINTGDDVISKYNLKKLLNVKDDVSPRKSRKSKKYLSSNDSSDYESESKKKKFKEHRDGSPMERRHYRGSERDYDPEESSTSRNENHHTKKSNRGHSDKYDNVYSDDEKPIKRNYGLLRADGQKIELSKIDRNRDYKNERKKSSKEQKVTTHVRKEKLSEEEKEKRYREMMANAAWRDLERKQNITKYEEEHAKEKADIQPYDTTFINKELHKAIKNQISVESRLKSNLNNIQRSSRAMECNFAKR